MSTDSQTLPSVIVLGGDANGLSVVRCLGKRGLRVYAINEHQAPVRHSRYCRWLPVPEDMSNEVAWTRYLLGPESAHLCGAVLLAASDDALEILNHNREALSRRFLLDDSNPDAQKCMLDKLRTYEVALAAGVPTPRFWVLRG